LSAFEDRSVYAHIRCEPREEYRMKSHRLLTAAAVIMLGLSTALAAVLGVPGSSAFAQPTGQASYGGVSFTYDTSLATNVQGQSVASNVGQDVMTAEIRPEHISFTFSGYPSKGVWTPQIRVIRFADYKAAQAQSDIANQLGALQTYLGASQPGAPLPVLPPVNAQRVLAEDVAPVAGAGATGVRFVASYAQGITPIASDNITYTYIGLTTDGKYYIEGTFPVALVTPLDPAPSPLTPENVQAYNRSVADTLSKTDPSGFAPTLDKLDKMMASIQVSATVIPGMPGTGASIYEEVLPTLGLLAALLLVAGLAMVVRSRATSPK
jgi:hypothetical protein